MRKVNGSIEQARQAISQLQGKDVTVRYRKGRVKADVYKARVEQIYSNVFVLTVYGEIFDRLSCSYTDVICGDVSLKENQHVKPQG